MITVADKTVTVTQSGKPLSVTKTYWGRFDGSGTYAKEYFGEDCYPAVLGFSGEVHATITFGGGDIPGTYEGSVIVDAGMKLTTPSTCGTPGYTKLLNGSNSSVYGYEPTVSWFVYTQVVLPTSGDSGPEVDINGTITNDKKTISGNIVFRMGFPSPFFSTNITLIETTSP